jgi:hypothetical protein
MVVLQQRSRAVQTVRLDDDVSVRPRVDPPRSVRRSLGLACLLWRDVERGCRCGVIANHERKETRPSLVVAAAP